jgi:hypothetical protein
MHHVRASRDTCLACLVRVTGHFRPLSWKQMPRPKRRTKAMSTRSLTGTVDTHGDAQITAHSAPPLQAMQSECRQVAQHDGPITRSRAARSRIKPHIHTLPLEVLSTIFILALASDEQLLRVVGGEASGPILRTPLPLCAVSSLWRSIALATPQL